MFTWQARFSDGTILNSESHVGPVSADLIDRDRVVEMTLFRDGYQVATLHLEPGQRLIYRRRVNLEVGGPETACHIMGWRQLVGDKVFQSVFLYFEDGRVEMSSSFKEDHPWLYSPKFREFEL